MRNSLIIAVLIFLGIIGFLLLNKNQQEQVPNNTETQNVATSTPSELTHSDGILTFSVPQDFGLAISKEQILVKSYIPPCDTPFMYCLYYMGDTYEGTNFESAGLSINKRQDLSDTESCLSTPPDGYTNMSPVASSTHTDYTMSLFTPLGDAGAGHYANGKEYRLYTKNTCYEFITRVGETQFANYPTGSIKEFTTDQRATMLSSLENIISSITLSNEHSLQLPK